MPGYKGLSDIRFERFKIEGLATFWDFLERLLNVFLENKVW
jgi:hypothetical protein